MKKHLTNSLKKILVVLILIMTIVNVFSMTPFYNNSYADNNSSSSTNAKPESERYGFLSLGKRYFYKTKSGHKVYFVDDNSRQYWDNQSGGLIGVGKKLDESSKYYKEAKKELEDAGLPLVLNAYGDYEYSYSPDQNRVTQQAGEEGNGTKKESDDTGDSKVDDVADGITGFILAPAKLIPLIAGKLLDMVLALFSGNGVSITLGDVIFNKIEITKLDFFNFNSGSEAANSIRKSVAVWYYSFRNLAAVILLGILLYTGLRMATATVADEKARYSEMLVNWVVSIALLFVLHYLMQFIIIINNQLVDLFASSYKQSDMTEPMNQMFHNAIFSVGFTEEMGSSICYVLLVGMTFVFLLSYLKRMVTVAFLIVISPLVTITYSIDKMNDGKSQALNIWFKEFAYNVLIQTFHCLSYLFLVDTGMSILTKEKSIAAIIIATLMVYFMYASEKIVRHIFHFRSNTMADTVKHAALVSTALGTFSGLGIRKGNKYSDLKEPSDEQVSQNEITKAEKRNAALREAQAEESNKYTGNFENEESGTGENYITSRGKTSKINPYRKSRNSKVGRAISAVTGNPIVAGYVNANKTLGKVLLTGGLSLATGNASTFMANEISTIAGSISEAKEGATIRSQSKLQQAYNDAEEDKKQQLIELRVKEEMRKEPDKNMDIEEQTKKENEIRKRIRRDEGKDIAKKAHNYMENRVSELTNGANPENESEQKLVKSINSLRVSYANQGMDEEKINKQIEKDIKKTKNGEYNNNSSIRKSAKEIKDDAVGVAKAVASPITDAKKHYYYSKNKDNTFINQSNTNSESKTKNDEHSTNNKNRFK